MHVADQISRPTKHHPQHPPSARFATGAAWTTPHPDRKRAQPTFTGAVSERHRGVAEPNLSRAASEARRTEERIEPELCLLVKAQAPIRRTIAALAGRFVFNHCWERLGFARLADYGTERLGLSARSLYDLAHTDRVLAGLPKIDRAFVRGELAWTKVRLLARVASGDDEERWLNLACRMTSAALAREVRAADVGAVERGGMGGGVGGAEEFDGEDQWKEEQWENVKIRCTSPVQGKWHRARQLAHRMAGRPVKPWECGEMVAAEVLSAIEMEPEGGDSVGEHGNAVSKAVAVGQQGDDIGQRAEAGTGGGAIGQAAEDRHQVGRVGQGKVAAGSANGHAESGSHTVDHEAMPSPWPVAPIAPGNSNDRTTGSGTTGNSATGNSATGNGTTAPIPVAASRSTSREVLHPLSLDWTTSAELPPHLRSLLTNLDKADAFELDARLCKAVALDQRLEAEIGSLLALVAHERRYLCHGFRSMEDYARERLGMAAGKVRTLLRLERAGSVCPALAAAYRDGRLSWVQAGALAPVVLIRHGDLTHREAWVEWAGQVSVRRLKEDVEWALLLNRTQPEQFVATGGLPSDAGCGSCGSDAAGASSRTGGATTGGATQCTKARGANPGIATVGGAADGGTTDEGTAIGAIASEVITGGGIAAGGISAEDTIAEDTTAEGIAAGSTTAQGVTAQPMTPGGTATEATDPSTSPDRQIGAQPRVSRGDTLLYFHAPSSVARLFRAVLCTVRRRIERQMGKLPTEGEAFEAMLDHVIDVWGGYGQRARAAHRVFERDGWRCTVPGCSSLTNLHDHHIVFRSAGGSNDLDNRTTLCVWHHLRGIHGGTVRCVGKAPSELRFELGVRSDEPPLLGFECGERRDFQPKNLFKRSMPSSMFSAELA